MERPGKQGSVCEMSVLPKVSSFPLCVLLTLERGVPGVPGIPLVLKKRGAGMMVFFWKLMSAFPGLFAFLPGDLVELRGVEGVSTAPWRSTIMHKHTVHPGLCKRMTKTLMCETALKLAYRRQRASWQMNG